MLEKFEMAGGSITGRNHTVVNKNNQDAYFGISNDQYAIAVVCDGCGSGKDSEVGAKIGVRMVVEAIAQQFQNENQIHKEIQVELNREFWQQLKLDLLIKLQEIAKLLGGNSSESLTEIINHYLLFTIVGVVISSTEAVTFSIGDGIIFANGELSYRGKFTDNAPPYLAYGLVRPDLINFQIHDRLPTNAVKSILIGTDGVEDLMAAEFSSLPKKSELVGAVSQFWQDDRYFSNPDQIRRKLSQINHESIKPNWENRTFTREIGLLPDDTTLIVIRRQSSN